VNGKVRDNILVAAGISEEEAKEKALASEKVKKHIERKKIKKTIFVKDKIINIVI
jgi:leucyl-tRNA synthetase